MGTLNPIVGPLPMSVGAGTVDTGEASTASIPIIGPNPPIIPIRLTHTFTEYRGNHIFENGLLTMTLIPGGYISYEGGCPTAPSYHFYLCDHEGNNCVVTNINGNIEQVNDYTPFGVLMKNDFTATPPSLTSTTARSSTVCMASTSKGKVIRQMVQRQQSQKKTSTK